MLKTRQSAHRARRDRSVPTHACDTGTTMLGYISGTRKKSCYGCVKAKRRCDLGYPICKRCCVKGYDCKYPSASPRDLSTESSGAVPAEVVIRVESAPDLEPPLTSVADSSTELSLINFNTSDSIVDPFLLRASDSIGSSASPESFEFNDFHVHDDWNIEIPRPMPRLPLTRTLLPEIVVPAFLSQAQTLFIISNLQAFVPSMAYSGTTIFLHKDLYRTHEPPAIEDCVAISALYMTKTARNQHILANTITSKISSLTAESGTWTLAQHLAAVQALIIYQVIRLFDPDLNLQDAAAPQNALLEFWSAHLWKRSFTCTQSFPSSYASWTFHESLRRTIMMSVFVRCAWSCLTCGGLASQVSVVARLPVTKDLQAWDCGTEEEWKVRPVGWLGEEGGVMSYGNMADCWNKERRVEELGSFGKILMAACRGKDDPRLLL